MTSHLTSICIIICIVINTFEIDTVTCNPLSEFNSTRDIFNINQRESKVLTWPNDTLDLTDDK